MKQNKVKADLNLKKDQNPHIEIINPHQLEFKTHIIEIQSPR